MIISLLQPNKSFIIIKLYSRQTTTNTGTNTRYTTKYIFDIAALFFAISIIISVLLGIYSKYTESYKVVPESSFWASDIWIMFYCQRLLQAVSLWALKKTAATGRPSSFSSANVRVLNLSLDGGASTVCLRFCLNKRNTNLWIPIFGLGIS